MNGLWEWWRKRFDKVQQLEAQVKELREAKRKSDRDWQKTIDELETENNHLREVQEEKDGIRRSHADSLANLTPQVRDWERYYQDHHTFLEKVRKILGNVLAYAQHEILIGEKQLELNRAAVPDMKHLFHEIDHFLHSHRSLRPKPLPEGESPYKEPLLDVEELLERPAQELKDKRFYLIPIEDIDDGGERTATWYSFQHLRDLIEAGAIDPERHFVRVEEGPENPPRKDREENGNEANQVDRVPVTDSGGNPLKVFGFPDYFGERVGRVPPTDQAGKPLKIHGLDVSLVKTGPETKQPPASQSDRADSDPGERPQPEPIRSYPSYDQPLIDVENHPEFRPE